MVGLEARLQASDLEMQSNRQKLMTLVSERDSALSEVASLRSEEHLLR